MNERIVQEIRDRHKMYLCAVCDRKVCFSCGHDKPCDVNTLLKELNIPY